MALMPSQDLWKSASVTAFVWWFDNSKYRMTLRFWFETDTIIALLRPSSQLLPCGIDATPDGAESLTQFYLFSSSSFWHTKAV